MLFKERVAAKLKKYFTFKWKYNKFKNNFINFYDIIKNVVVCLYNL